MLKTTSISNSNTQKKPKLVTIFAVTTEVKSIDFVVNNIINGSWEVVPQNCGFRMFSNRNTATNELNTYMKKTTEGKTGNFFGTLITFDVEKSKITQGRDNSLSINDSENRKIKSQMVETLSNITPKPKLEFTSQAVGRVFIELKKELITLIENFKKQKAQNKKDTTKYDLAKKMHEEITNFYPLIRVDHYFLNKYFEIPSQKSNSPQSKKMVNKSEETKKLSTKTKESGKFYEKLNGFAAKDAVLYTEMGSDKQEEYPLDPSPENPTTTTTTTSSHARKQASKEKGKGTRHTTKTQRDDSGDYNHKTDTDLAEAEVYNHRSDNSEQNDHNSDENSENNDSVLQTDQNNSPPKGQDNVSISALTANQTYQTISNHTRSQRSGTYNNTEYQGMLSLPPSSQTPPINGGDGLGYGTPHQINSVGLGYGTSHSDGDGSGYDNLLSIGGERRGFLPDNMPSQPVENIDDREYDDMPSKAEAKLF